ncbi:MAG: hypothetical protein CL824_04155 [Crocinitomicaceae bacterium]|nr:hypothetical protein [Crocinitomicaceae bacterium]
MKYFYCLTFVLSSFVLFSQDKTEIIQQRIEFISEQLQTEDIDLTNITLQLNYYFSHPLNLNSASLEELEELTLLSAVQINDLLLHRKRFGKLISKYELQSLKYWDLQTIELLAPFIYVDDKLDNIHISFKEALKQGKFEWFLRYQPTLEDKAGYADVPDSIMETSNNFYHGNSDRYYSRFRYTYKTNISIGVTAEKDPGEQFFRGAQKNGFDFYSFHAYYKGGKYIKSFALGDYQIQIGQGLNMWSSYAFGKSADISTMKRTAMPIRPYTSVDENRYMRGAAIDFGFGNFSLLTFASVKNVDAVTIADSSIEDLEFVSTINLSGMHRTNSEIEKQNGLQEYIGGLNLRYQNNGLKLGLAAVYQGYDKEFNKEIRPYNQYDFRGKENFSFSGDYNYIYKNVNLFGEISKNRYNQNDTIKGGLAMVHGALIFLDPRLSLGMLYRSYDKDYNTFYNAGFSEGGRTQNENGFYTGLNFKFNKAWSLSSYVDIFHFSWMKYLVDAPSSGHEFLIQQTYKPNKIFKIYARYRQQLRQKNSRDSDNTVTEIEDVLQRNYRINFDYNVNKYIKIKSRVEYVSISRPSNTPEDGIILTQDFIYKPKSIPFNLAIRYALFDTDSYDTRVYTYENNALYAFSVPSYYYQGSRAYVLVRYKFRKHLDIWMRYGVFLYNNRQSISSGLEEIKGSRRSDFILQLRFTF